jgi:hypothetical protein
MLLAVRLASSMLSKRNGPRRVMPEAVAFFRVSYPRGLLEALRGKPGINLLANLVLR